MIQAASNTLVSIFLRPITDDVIVPVTRGSYQFVSDSEKDYTFYNFTQLKTVTISDTVEIINYSFAKCTCDIIWGENPTVNTFKSAFGNYKGETLIIPVSVKAFIGGFGNASKLKNVYYDGTLKQWFEITRTDSLGSSPLYDNHALFYILDENGSVTYNGKNYSLLVNVIVPEGITDIYAHTFDSFTQLESIIICEGVTTIGPWALSRCTNLVTILLPNSITTIREYATYYMSSSLVGYYCGTEEEAQNISWDNGLGNFNELKFRIRYYSEEEPEERKFNYWHYDSNNNPVKW